RSRDFKQEAGQLSGGLDAQHPRQQGVVGEVIVEDLVGQCHALQAAGVAAGDYLGDTVKQDVAHALSLYWSLWERRGGGRCSPCGLGVPCGKLVSARAQAEIEPALRAAPVADGLL